LRRLFPARLPPGISLVSLPKYTIFILLDRISVAPPLTLPDPIRPLVSHHLTRHFPRNMNTNTQSHQQRRRLPQGLAIPPSPPESHPSQHSQSTIIYQHDLPKSRYSSNAYQDVQFQPTLARDQQRKEMVAKAQIQQSWRLQNPDVGHEMQQQLQRDVHTAFALEQQREAHKWIHAARKLAACLDLASSPLSVLPRLTPRNPNAPRIQMLPPKPKNRICPSGHQYLESTGYIRSVPVFRPGFDIRQAVPDRANDRDAGFLRAYHISRGSEGVRQAALERAAWDVQMLEWRDGVKSLPADERRADGRQS
jgi:hypothetical protein